MFMPRLDNSALYKSGGMRTALFKVDTGTRDHEVSNLNWDWEIEGRNAYLIPASFVKDKRDRPMVGNG